MRSRRWIADRENLFEELGKIKKPFGIANRSGTGRTPQHLVKEPEMLNYNYNSTLEQIRTKFSKCSGHLKLKRTKLSELLKC